MVTITTDTFKHQLEGFGCVLTGDVHLALLPRIACRPAEFPQPRLVGDGVCRCVGQYVQTERPDVVAVHVEVKAQTSIVALYGEGLTDVSGLVTLDTRSTAFDVDVVARGVLVGMVKWWTGKSTGGFSTGHQPIKIIIHLSI